VSAFIPALRGAFLFLSRQQALRRWMETAPEARRFTSRFIAGLELEDALAVVRSLRSQNVLASLDYLGENVSTAAEATHSRDSYIAAIRRICAERLGATVSVKVTSLGLDISRDLCHENVDLLVRTAQECSVRTEFDMEDTSYTDRNLELVHAMHQRYPGAVRAVIQAYLYRSETDVEELCRRGIPVRLCKGAYRESVVFAWQRSEEVDANFKRLTRVLFARGTHPAIATHDEAMLREAFASASAHGLTADQWEVQMLYGVRRALQRRIVENGLALRLYVPYGTAWYPYFMRRIAERPANAVFVARNVVTNN
jgi:proline dehydrogenase